MSTIDPDAFSAEAGAMVRRRRQELGLEQADLANLAGTSRRFVYALEHGKTTVRLDKLLDVLDVLGLELHVSIRTGEPLG